MYSLIIDSATKILYISLIKDEKLLDEIYLEGRLDHAKNIVYKIDEILNKNNITTRDLGEVIVGIGPGSYTGVRMGVAVGKMLAVFMNIKLYTISTLKLMSSGYKDIALVKIDARRGNSFACIIDNINDKYILDEGMYENTFLEENKYNIVVSDENYKVDYKTILKDKKLVENPHLLVPNYLRETEAERNLHD